jgi:magnesium-transporting ATPase (P-type)
MIGYGVCLNSDAQPTINKSVFEQIGNKTECALLELAFLLGFDFREVRKTEEVVGTIPFSS